MTEPIQDSLLNAAKLGQEQVNTFVKERPIKHDGNEGHIKLQDPLKKTKPLTFSSLYEVAKENKVKDKAVTIKADRSILQRIITAYGAGRTVDLHSILRHELMPVPLALAELNGKLRSGNKSGLLDVLTKDIVCPPSIVLDQPSTLIIDGQARVVAIGKPPNCKTFGELGDVFVESVLKSGHQYRRIDVVFDRYRPESIKSDTRAKRSKGTRPVRKLIEDNSVPLPNSWPDFIALSENKTDLANFLSEHLLANAPMDKTVVISAAFKEEDTVKSSDLSLDISPLKGWHEEADTRIILPGGVLP